MDTMNILFKSKNDKRKLLWTNFKVVSKGPGEDCTIINEFDKAVQGDVGAAKRQCGFSARIFPNGHP